ncbi:Mitochondrial uncoupling protein 4 [Echinococcus granulosus]|uniref:Mitochondrial uncoupling protein 4 n=1 Tax=Echinococcus granulosus TaxID=6210 RepID=W6UHX3_ECHGR|nr:Mitochondrial uncoupling protein 4 [Echinococcus granulosus]EUB60666.1 Mitochondrial uncoupling protein 4 [Echinococcus granulosus]KAH9282822.1 Mitochondrial uncoupling protein 4 [Echinococcus granulosus]
MDLKPFRRVVHDIHDSHPQVSHFTICCISAFIGETVTYPLDSVKTRLQVAGELSVTKVRPRLFPLIVLTVKNEGIFSFWQGLSPALYRHFLYTGARMPIYEIIRNRVFDMPPASDKARHELEVARCKESQDSLSRSYVLHAAAGGIISGALAQFICSPTDLYKVRLQTEQRMSLVATTPVIDSTGRPIPSVAHSPKHRLAHSVTFRQLVKESGLLGLWRGGLPNVQRAALVNMGEMTTYDTAKRWLQRRFGLTDGPLLHGCASTMSGFVSACLGTPADFIKTRMMNQRVVTTSGVPLSPLYTGMIDCAIKVVKQEGFFTLYRGFFLIWGRMAPWSLTFWLTYEKMRAFIGAGGF